MGIKSTNFKPLKNIFKIRYIILGTIVLGGFLIIRQYNWEVKRFQDNETAIPVDTTEAKQVHLKYGFPIDDFTITTNKVKKRQTLSVILQHHNISHKKIYQIAQKAKKVFNVKRIKPGHEYSLLLAKDSLGTPEYFIYENTPTEYIVFDLRDTVNVYRGEKEITRVRKTIADTIESSLWDAMAKNGANPVLAIDLSEIYAWTIDFFEIRKGDYFKIIYEEEYVDGEPIHVHHIIAVNFNHRNTNNYAFVFEENGKQGYFDENGNSLQKAFLKAPLRFSRISSRYSNRRFHPVLKRYRPHHGVDYAAPTGTPVRAIGDGVVAKKGYQKNGGGRYLTIKHNGVYSTTYMHFSRYAKNMKPGSLVKQGQTIGYVGQSGLATGPHLDFRVYKNGKPVNPLKIKSPPVSPIKKENLAEFNREKNKLLLELYPSQQTAEQLL